MSNMHRIRWIDSQIREKRHPNCRIIAEKFEISARQASRDIEYMRFSLGAPVEYCADKNGYHYTDSAFELPSVFISEEEKQALSYLAYKYSETGSEHAMRLAGLFSRLSGEDMISKGASRNIPVYGLKGKETVIFHRLKKAAADLEKVEMEYINSRNELSRRTFHPYKLFSAMQTTYVVGYCELRQELRVFKLPRIRSVIGAGEHFEVPVTFRPDDYADETSLARKDPFTARVRFSYPPQTGSYKIEIVSVNDSVYEISFQDSGEIISMLLSQRPDFAVISPGWLREKLLKRINTIAANNS